MEWAVRKGGGELAAFPDLTVQISPSGQLVSTAAKEVIVLSFILHITSFSDLIIRRGVAGAVLQTPSSLIYSLSLLVILSSQSSKLHFSQTVRARELTILLTQKI